MSQEALKLRSEKWLRTYCRSIEDIDYDTFISAVKYSDGEYIHINGEDAHGTIPSDVWYHVEVVTGIHFDEPPTYFSCSC